MCLLSARFADDCPPSRELTLGSRFLFFFVLFVHDCLCCLCCVFVSYHPLLHPHAREVLCVLLWFTIDPCHPQISPVRTPFSTPSPSFAGSPRYSSDFCCSLALSHLAPIPPGSVVVSAAALSLRRLSKRKKTKEVVTESEREALLYIKREQCFSRRARCALAVCEVSALVPHAGSLLLPCRAALYSSLLPPFCMCVCVQITRAFTRFTNQATPFYTKIPLKYP